jgi:AbiV family abortive infection protein
MPVKDPLKGIEICQAVGKRLYDDADTMFEGDRYHTAIALYVFAYEEFGRARYLCLHLLSGKEIDENEFDKLKDSGKAHTRKILVDPLAFGEILKNDSPESYEARRKQAEILGMPFVRIERAQATKLHNDTMKIFGRLNMLKMAMLYSRYENGQWQSAKGFSDKSLNQVCCYLKSEVIRVYHNNRLNLFQYHNLIGVKGTEISETQRKLMLDNEDRQAMVRLDKEYRSARFLRWLTMTKAILDSI